MSSFLDAAEHAECGLSLAAEGKLDCIMRRPRHDRNRGCLRIGGQNRQARRQPRQS